MKTMRFTRGAHAACSALVYRELGVDPSHLWIAPLRQFCVNRLSLNGKERNNENMIRTVNHWVMGMGMGK